MIIVLADDLTGAAELGGIALRYGIKVEITTRLYPDSDADLLIIATNTRSLPVATASLIIGKIADELVKARPSRLFVKIDSVLRGHVLTEISILKNRLNLKRALLVPANPSLGRTIENGHYLLDGQPVHLTSFSGDPEFPIRSSFIPAMLGAAPEEVKVLTKHQVMPDNGVVVGEVKERSDLEFWSGNLDEDTLAAGAAEFFAVVLAGEYNLPRPLPFSLPLARRPERKPALMIAGSAFRKGRVIKGDSIPVNLITPEIIQFPSAAENWIKKIIAGLESCERAAIAIDSGMDREDISAMNIRSFVALAVARVATRIKIMEFLVEGGSTAAAVVAELGIDKLYPLEELAPGVIRMRAGGTADKLITMKPGSYDWPSYIFSSENSEKEQTNDC